MPNQWSSIHSIFTDLTGELEWHSVEPLAEPDQTTEELQAGGKFGVIMMLAPEQEAIYPWLNPETERRVREILDRP